MAAVRVQDYLTPLAEPALVRAVFGGYRLTMGGTPSAECLAVLCAQVFLESGRGQKMHCWNPGNRKTPRDWDALFCAYKCDEIFDEPTAAFAQRLGDCLIQPWKNDSRTGKPLFRVVLPDSHPWARFCAFESAEEGMADYVALLACSDRYRAAWTLAARGDADGFARVLGVAGYYTADPATYARGVVSIAAALLPLCRATLASFDRGLTDDEVSEIAAAVSNTVANDLIWNHDRHEVLAA
jgi:hypothetical protein